MPHWQPSCFPLCVNLKQTKWRHCPPPHLYKLAEQVFTIPCDVPAAWSQIAHCVDANLFGKPPKLQAS